MHRFIFYRCDIVEQVEDQMKLLQNCWSEILVFDLLLLQTTHSDSEGLLTVRHVGRRRDERCRSVERYCFKLDKTLSRTLTCQNPFTRAVSWQLQRLALFSSQCTINIVHANKAGLGHIAVTNKKFSNIPVKS